MQRLAFGAIRLISGQSHFALLRRLASEPAVFEKSSAIHVLKDSASTLLQRLSRSSVLEKHVGSGKVAPFDLVKPELKELASNCIRLLGSNNKLLTQVASHYFLQQGKQMRPGLVLLMSLATSSLSTGVIVPSQIRLAEITELIHTASLVHDDVIDNADTRRNQPSVPAVYGAKQAVLAGDFLLARASVALSRLRNVDVIELLSTVIADLVEGEFMQMDSRADSVLSFDHYIQKTFLKTSSLIAKSTRAAALLGGHDESVAETAYLYGKHLGIAFQIVDDILDYTGTDSSLGKPADTDLSLGLATAPALYAQEEFPEMTELIVRRFCEKGDVQRARELVLKSKGLDRSRQLAVEHCRMAVDAVMALPESPARASLISITDKVLTRTK